MYRTIEKMVAFKKAALIYS